jgi:hypothetical protein
MAASLNDPPLLTVYKNLQTLPFFLVRFHSSASLPSLPIRSHLLTFPVLCMSASPSFFFHFATSSNFPSHSARPELDCGHPDHYDRALKSNRSNHLPTARPFADPPFAAIQARNHMTFLTPSTRSELCLRVSLQPTPSPSAPLHPQVVLQ